MPTDVHKFLQVPLTTLMPPILLKWQYGRCPHRMRQLGAGQG